MEQERKEEKKDERGNKAEIKKEKVKKWLENKYNLGFLGIVVFAIFIRLYYFFLTKQQPLWWDEAEYMSFAKNLAGIPTNVVLAGNRISLVSYLASIFFRIGFSEATIKFFLEVIPSILIVFLTYKICVLMYEDKKIALISTFLMASFWSILFNTLRFQIDVPALLFAFLGLYVFWQGYERKEKIFGFIAEKWAIPLTVCFVILMYLTRKGYFMFGFFFLFFMLFTRNIKALIKDKYNWLAFFILIIFLITGKFIFPSATTTAFSQYYRSEVPFSLIPLQIFSVYFKNISHPTISPLSYLFWFGLIIIAFNLFVSIGHLKSSKKARSDLFVFLSIFITMIYFLFFLRTYQLGDPRWFFPLILGCFICISKGTLTVTDYIKKYNKIIAVLILVLLIGYGGYYELEYANMIIKNKMETYNGIKDSGLFLKGIAKENDVIISKSVFQTAYYAERKTIFPDPSISLEEFLSMLREDKTIRFLVVSIWEPGHPEWMIKTFYSNNQIMGVEILFMDTIINFATNQQSIQQEKTYYDISFRLLDVSNGAFVYEVMRV